MRSFFLTEVSLHLKTLLLLFCRLAVTGQLTHIAPIQVEDYKFVHSCLSHPESVVKVAIPSPTMVHFRGGRASIDINSYPNMDSFFEDLAQVYRDEIKALYEAGVSLFFTILSVHQFGIDVLLFSCFIVSIHSIR